MHKIINKLIHNKFVLYAIVSLTMINIFGYMMTGCIYTVTFFAVTAFINSMFTKNMILILGGSLLLTNIFMVCKVVKEGFVYTSTEGFEGTKKEGLAINTPIGSVNTSSDSSKDDKPDSSKDKPDSSKDDSKNNDSSDSMTQEECNKKGYKWSNNKCVPDSMTTGYRKNDNYIDHAATLSEAYGDLEGLLGKDGINGLTQDTQALVNQQKKMMEMMDNMGPMVEQVKGMMDSMGGSEGMQKMLGAFAKK